jgi:predicted transposase/invertase (TIGR01784 family)
MKARYISPFTDFGFKKLFGEEASKDLLIDFLNQFLPEHHRIQTLAFRNSEQMGATDYDRKAIFDIYCENQNGEKFIVELQKAKQNFFKDRTVYYSTFPIKEQAEKGDWVFELKAVYCIGILDFVFDESEEKGEYLHTVKLKDQNNKVFYDKLTFIYIEMPNFNKNENELFDKKDKWLYFLKNLEDFDHIPAILGEKIFDSAFQKAELAKLDTNEMFKYEQSLKIYRDLNNVIDYARFEGKEEGRAEGKEEGRAEGKEEGIQQRNLEVARDLKKNNITIEVIMQVTGLSREEIEAL